jgi:hypothetical protein
MAAQPRDALADTEEVREATELQDLQVRVVRLSELGGKPAATELDELPAPTHPTPDTRAHPTPQPQARAAERPQARPAPQPQARPAHHPPAQQPPQPRAGPAPQPKARSAPPPRAPQSPEPSQPFRTRELAAPAPKPSPEPSPAAAKRTAAPAVAAQPEPAPRGRLINSRRLSLVLVAVVLYYGWTTDTGRYINPYRGLGYILGIIGGSLMLVLLAYSLRKRWAWLEFMGSTPNWFRFHMVLGVVGPLCILYHANFSTGATNSNVALFTMLAVALSGVIGRYLYSHIHNGLYGRRLELAELRADAEGLHSLSSRLGFVPDLLTRIEGAEEQLLQAGPHLSVLGFARPVVVGVVGARARRQLHRYIRRALQAQSRQSAVVRAEQKRLCYSARVYVDRRLAATRRVAEFEGFERLFSLWHSLHIPLIFVMVIAAIIHVIAVHIY